MTREGTDASSDPWIYIGRVARPHGVRGGVKLHLENPEGDLLRPGIVLRLELPKAASRELEVTRVYGAGNVDLADVINRDQAEALRDARVHVRRSDFPPPDEDETYLVDLLGAEVRHVDGRVLGVLESFSDNRAQPLAEVRTPKEDGARLVLVPFVPGIVSDVDEDAGIVVLSPPLGLFEELPDEEGRVGEGANAPPPSGGTSGRRRRTSRTKRDEGSPS